MSILVASQGSALVGNGQRRQMVCAISISGVRLRSDRLELTLQWQTLWVTQRSIRRTSKRTTANLRRSAFAEDVNDGDQRFINLPGPRCLEEKFIRLTHEGIILLACVLCLAC